MSAGVSPVRISDVLGATLERGAGGADRVAGAARLFLDRDLDAGVLERVPRRGRGDRRRRGRRRARARRRSPSRPCAGRAPGAGASAARSACGCRALRPSRRLRSASRSRQGDDGWGARIRTWDRGTKTRCLTTWLRPTAAEYRRAAPGVSGHPRYDAGCSRSVKRKTSARTARIASTTYASVLKKAKRSGTSRTRSLRRREDPARLAHHRRLVVAARTGPSSRPRRCQRRRPPTRGSRRRSREGPRRRRSRARAACGARRGSRPGPASSLEWPSRTSYQAGSATQTRPRRGDFDRLRARPRRGSRRGRRRSGRRRSRRLGTPPRPVSSAASGEEARSFGGSAARSAARLRARRSSRARGAPLGEAARRRRSGA